MELATIRTLGTSLAIRTPRAPLLEEEGDAGCIALPLDSIDPHGFHRPRAVTRLAADDHPADTFEIKRAQILLERLDRHEK